MLISQQRSTAAAANEPTILAENRPVRIFSVIQTSFLFSQQQRKKEEY